MTSRGGVSNYIAPVDGLAEHFRLLRRWKMSWYVLCVILALVRVLQASGHDGELPIGLRVPSSLYVRADVNVVSTRAREPQQVAMVMLPCLRPNLIPSL